MNRDPWHSSPNVPKSGDGYRDGRSLYAAYFVPNHADPFGTLTWDVNPCRINMTYTLGITWSGNWTADRKESYMRSLRNSIQNQWSNHRFHIYPEKSCCPCYNEGWNASIDVKVVEGSGDNNVTAVANPQNPNGTWPFVGSWVRPGPPGSGSAQLDEADPFQRPDIPQVPAAHEFGHMLGIQHPGHNITGSDGMPISPNDGPEYTHQGLDEQGNPVGPTDLMGQGNNMRPFYFQNWADELDRRYPECKKFTIR